jgi:glycerol-3-phosphate dehydrogenase
VAPSGEPWPHRAEAARWKPEAGAAAIDPLSLYGARAGEVRALIDADATLGEAICEHNPEVLAQVAYAVEREDAATLGDVLLRRLPCGWSACRALDGAERAAGVMSARLGWDEARVAAEVASYREELAETLVPVSAIEGAAGVER